VCDNWSTLWVISAAAGDGFRVKWDTLYYSCLYSLWKFRYKSQDDFHFNLCIYSVPKALFSHRYQRAAHFSVFFLIIQSDFFLSNSIWTSFQPGVESTACSSQLLTVMIEIEIWRHFVCINVNKCDAGLTRHNCWGIFRSRHTGNVCTFHVIFLLVTLVVLIVSRVAQSV
jgi:hypothetical protein